MVLAGDFLVEVFLVEGFLALEVDLAASSLERRARRDFRREAVFFFRRPFLTALSYSLWIFFMFSVEGLVLKAFRASLMLFLISWFLS